MKELAMDHDIDPRDKLIADIGNLSNVEIFNNSLLLAVYIRPTKTKSGIYLTDKYADEDKYQGKVGLLVKKGPAAFMDESGEWFANERFALRDWLVFRPSDGWSITVNGVLCRMLLDTQVKMRIQSPDCAW